MLEALKEALHTAQSELALADIALMEATAHQQVAFASATKLASAVAALSGEPSALQLTSPLTGEAIEATESQRRESQTPSIHDMTPDEFNAQRKAKQAQKRREDDEWRSQNDPLYHMKCSGCGLTGTLAQTLMTAPSGQQVAMKVCTKCNNQIMG